MTSEAFVQRETGFSMVQRSCQRNPLTGGVVFLAVQPLSQHKCCQRQEQQDRKASVNSVTLWQASQRGALALASGFSAALRAARSA